jgi:soluble lytic murein transglycosylase-like protein
VKAGKSRARRWIAVGIGLVLVVAVAAEMRRPLTRAANEVRREISVSSGVTRVEGHAELLRRVGAEVGLDPNLLAGVMFVESRGKVGALSGKEALGLFQLKLETAIERAVLIGLEAPTRGELLEDGELNARIGAHHLLWLLARYKGDIERALIAYNAGPGRLERWIKEHGSFARWRDAAESSGRSDVLAYVRDVLDERDFFAARGNIVAPIGPPVPAPATNSMPHAESFVGPLAPSENHGDP